MYQVTSRKNKTKNKIVEAFVGNNIDFTIEQQVLLAVLITTIVGGVLTVIQNTITKLPAILSIVNSSLTVILIVLYILVRVFKIYKNISSLFLLLLFVSFSVCWFPNGGIQGSIPYFYLTLLAYIIYLTKGIKQFVFLSVFFVNITALFYIEYTFPDIATPYPGREAQFFDMYFSFVLLLFFIAFIVYILKILYQQEQKNAIDIIEKYRKSSVRLKEKYAEFVNLLTLRERDIFEKIIEGKSNKEIATYLFIDEGTVKNHITTIYKKLDVNKRVDLINKINTFTRLNINKADILQEIERYN